MQDSNMLAGFNSLDNPETAVPGAASAARQPMIFSKQMSLTGGGASRQLGSADQQTDGQNTHNSRVKANHAIGVGMMGAQSSSMIIGSRGGFRQRHMDSRPNQQAGPGSLTRINMTDSRHNSNIYGTLGGNGGNIINLSKSLENHNNNFTVDRRYTESL